MYFLIGSVLILADTHSLGIRNCIQKKKIVLEYL